MSRCENETLSPAHARKTLAILNQTYPEAHCALKFRNPWELLVATILSAQCTDVRVNQVTEDLFSQYPGPGEMAQASQDDLENAIRSTGFFRNKAKNLQACSRIVCKVHRGRVPQSLEDLTALPGVGRKTANVVLGNAFGKAGMVVDTHVKRISRRLGWTNQTDPEKIETDLCGLLPQKSWTQAGHILIAHGRALCKAPTPLCSQCPVQARCPRNGVNRAR